MGKGKPMENEIKYKADWCWGQKDKLDELLYEFVNCKTEEYRKKIYLEIRKLFNENHRTTNDSKALDEDDVLETIHQAKLDWFNTHLPDVSEDEYLAKAICQTFGKDGWISVEERLPKVGQEIICLTDKKEKLIPRKSLVTFMKDFGCIYCNKDGYFFENKTDIRILKFSMVTHWMPLPKEPEGKER